MQAVDETRIIAVNVAERVVMDDSGELIPIVDLMDDDGDICLDEDCAVGAICGPNKDGKWCFVLLSEYVFNRPIN